MPKPQAYIKRLQTSKRQGKEVGKILIKEVAKIEPTPMYVSLNCFKKDSGDFGLSLNTRFTITSKEIPDKNLIARVVASKQVLKNNVKFINKLLSLSESNYEEIDNEEVRNSIYSTFEELQEMKYEIPISLIDPLNYGRHGLQQQNLLTSGASNFSGLMAKQLEHCLEIYSNFIDFTYGYLKNEASREFLNEYKQNSQKLEALIKNLSSSLKSGEKNIDFVPNLIRKLNTNKVSVSL